MWSLSSPAADLHFILSLQPTSWLHVLTSGPCFSIPSFKTTFNAALLDFNVALDLHLILVQSWLRMTYGWWKALLEGTQMKRSMDVLISLAALIVLFIPCIFVAFLIRTTSRGPSIFWSQRVGLKGKVFWMPKFRTMKIETPSAATALLASPENYVTGIGKILRSTSMDEVPQFLSVLRGDMSLVGPRPVLPSESELIKRGEGWCKSLDPAYQGWRRSMDDYLTVDDKVAFDRGTCTFSFFRRQILWQPLSWLSWTRY